MDLNCSWAPALSALSIARSWHKERSWNPVFCCMLKATFSQPAWWFLVSLVSGSCWSLLAWVWLSPRIPVQPGFVLAAQLG